MSKGPTFLNLLLLKERKPPLISIFTLLAWVFVLHTNTLSRSLFSLCLSLSVCLYNYDTQREKEKLATVCNILCILVTGLLYFGFLCFYFAAIDEGLRRVLGFCTNHEEACCAYHCYIWTIPHFFFLPPIFLQFQRINFNLYVFPLFFFISFFFISAQYLLNRK